jgi:hypothetical protein
VALGAIFGFARRSKKMIGYSVDGRLCNDAHHSPDNNIDRVVRPRRI